MRLINIVGIYKITKKSNGKSYIGQSNDIFRRFQEHKRNKIIPIDKAIHKYGIDSFTFEILEECSIEELDEREKYWIHYYNTYLGFGYNCNEGGGNFQGSNNGRAKLSEEDIFFIRECYNKHFNRKEVYEKFKDKITFSYFASIWDGTNWSYIHSDVFTKENKDYYKYHTTDGEKSSFSVFSNEEVIAYRKRYVFETAKQMYPEVSNRISFDGFQKILWGYTYSNLPIYKKKEKKWINVEACNDYPLLEAE